MHLDSGDKLPDFNLKLGEGDVISLPSAIETDYVMVLFYRGHWWPFCRRLLDGYEAHIDALKAMGLSVYAASSDALDKAVEVAAGLSFPVAWGIDQDLATSLGAFWDKQKNFIQPTELLVNKTGQLISSTYSSSPLGRTDPKEVLVLLNYLARMKA